MNVKFCMDIAFEISPTSSAQLKMSVSVLLLPLHTFRT